MNTKCTKKQLRPWDEFSRKFRLQGSPRAYPVVILPSRCVLEEILTPGKSEWCLVYSDSKLHGEIISSAYLLPGALGIDTDFLELETFWGNRFQIVYKKSNKIIIQWYCYECIWIWNIYGCRAVVMNIFKSLCC